MGKVVPCVRFDGERELPGFMYKDERHGSISPCFTYDPLSETSKRQAMKMALLSGSEELERLEREVRKELQEEDDGEM